MLKIENLTFEYVKNTKVLKNLNCGYKEGLNIVLSNRGEGKTTLLDLFLFPQKNQSEITLFDVPITAELTKEEFSAIQADWFLNDKKTPSENFENSKHDNKLPGELICKTVIANRLNVPISQISTIEKFEIAILRSLKKLPSVLILDSPFHEASEDDKLSLLETLERVIELYQSHVSKPICVVLMSRKFNVEERVVSLLHGGNIIETESYDKIQNTPKNTLVAINFAKYPLNVFSSNGENFYIDADKVKIGRGDLKGKVLQIRSDSMIIELDSADMQLPIVEGVEVGDEIKIDVNGAKQSFASNK